MGKFYSTKIIELGSAAFRQPKSDTHCRFIHGYQLKAKIWFSCNELDGNNWVFDFGGLKELRERLQRQFDHKCVITKDDPAKHVFKELERYGAVDLVVMDGVGIEKFAEYVFNEANTFVTYKSSNRVWVERVEVFEHELNSAIYEKQSAANCTCKEEKFDTPLRTLEEIKIEQQPPSDPPNPYAAPVGNKVTSGWSNPFGGTSWGV